MRGKEVGETPTSASCVQSDRATQRFEGKVREEVLPVGLLFLPAFGEGRVLVAEVAQRARRQTVCGGHQGVDIAVSHSQRMVVRANRRDLAPKRLTAYRTSQALQALRWNPIIGSHRQRPPNSAISARRDYRCGGMESTQE